MLPLSDNIPSRRTPFVNYGLIATCIVVFVLEWINPNLVRVWSFKPAYLLSSKFFEVGPLFVAGTMLISIFLHGGLLHIATNMLVLWVFGDNVEDRLGHGTFLGFYIGCGIIGNLAHSLSTLFGLIHGPGALGVGVIGASGAIAGVMGAYLVLVRGSSVKTLVLLFFILTVINIPAPFFIVLWFIIQLFSGLVTLAGGGAAVAYWAHIGGFVAGYLLGKALRPGGPRQRERPRVIQIDVRDA